VGGCVAFARRQAAVVRTAVDPEDNADDVATNLLARLMLSHPLSALVLGALRQSRGPGRSRPSASARVALWIAISRRALTPGMPTRVGDIARCDADWPCADLASDSKIQHHVAVARGKSGTVDGRGRTREQLVGIQPGSWWARQETAPAR